jgi:tRNA(Arg) A34 adenosine deaminase TadA
MTSASTHSAEDLVSKLLTVTESSIVPLTRSQVSSGSKLFGAAILSRYSLEPVTVATNNERASPLLHGEINCIQTFFASPKEGRPQPKDCIFFATHEPCSLCLSGITWSGFNEFYYLFTYEDSRDLFGIPYDIDILQSVYQVASPADTPETLAAKPLYNRTNKFFKARSVADLVATMEDGTEKSKWIAEITRIKALYNELSDTYQKGKATGHETSSVFQ